MNVVVSQPMYLPWVGLFEQIRLADIYVHYDDVQLPQGRSFISRVQVKADRNTTWLSVPIDRKRSGKQINEVILVPGTHWRNKHFKTLNNAYAKARHRDEMLSLAEEIIFYSTDKLSELNIYGIELLAKWLGLGARFIRSSSLNISGTASNRLISICQHCGAKKYISGLGGLNYLDYSEFEHAGIDVEYMNYLKLPYSQLHGEFTPYVTILDAIANTGSATNELVCSGTQSWRVFDNE